MDIIVFIVGVAAALILVQLFLGIQKNVQTRRVYQYLLEDARKRARQSFSIIVFLDRRANTLFPLLDHLRALDYTKLQIVIVVKQTAGSKAASELQTYRRRYAVKALRVIRHKKGMTLESIAKRYATHTYIMAMSSHDRLSSRFFLAASQILVSSRQKILAVREVVRPAGSFSQALNALGSLYYYASLPLIRQGRIISARTIIQRQALLSGNTLKASYYLPGQWFITPAPQAPMREKTKYPLYLAVTVIGVAALAAYLLAAHFTNTSTAILYGYVILLTPVILTLVIMLSLKGYSLIDYINLVLFVPLAPLYAALYLGGKGLRWIIVPRHQQLSVQR